MAVHPQSLEAEVEAYLCDIKCAMTWSNTGRYICYCDVFELCIHIVVGQSKVYPTIFVMAMDILPFKVPQFHVNAFFHQERRQPWHSEIR